MNQKFKSRMAVPMDMLFAIFVGNCLLASALLATNTERPTDEQTVEQCTTVDHAMMLPNQLSIQLILIRR